MPRLSTGYIIVGAYADKVRKTLFAQLSEAIKSKEVTSQEVARAIGELNRFLYHILVEQLNSDKGDVVRAALDYKLEDGKIAWDYSTLKVELFKRVSDEKIDEIVDQAVKQLGAILVKAPAYNVELASKTTTGDYVFKVCVDEREIGYLLITPLNEQIVIRGACLEPSPVVIEKALRTIKGPVEEAVSAEIQDILRSARPSELEDAEKMIKSIKALIGA